MDGNDLSALGELGEASGDAASNSQSQSGDLDNVRSSVATLPTSHSTNPNDGGGEGKDAGAAGEGKDADGKGEAGGAAEEDGKDAGSDDDYGSDFDEDGELGRGGVEVS